jgi:Asp-tRNA(Asn)/Glu-tRNA(Gln) amidotransferase C subunit
MADETKITPEIVKQRAALAGISLDEDRLEDIATTMEAALAPLHSLDLRAIRLVEPAVTFEAAWPE